MKNNFFEEFIHDIRKNPFQVVIRLKQVPNLLRLTYGNKESNQILMIEELNDKEEIITTALFKGNRNEGPDWLKEIRKTFNYFPASEWIKNQDVFVDSYIFPIKNPLFYK